MRGVSSSVQLGEKPTPRKPMPSASPTAQHLVEVLLRLRAHLVHGLSGAPESSNCPPGSSETVPAGLALGRLSAMMLSPP